MAVQALAVEIVVIPIVRIIRKAVAAPLATKAVLLFVQIIVIIQVEVVLVRVVLPNVKMEGVTPEVEIHVMAPVRIAATKNVLRDVLVVVKIDVLGVVKQLAMMAAILNAIGPVAPEVAVDAYRLAKSIAVILVIGIAIPKFKANDKD